MRLGQKRISTPKNSQLRRSPRLGQALLEFAIISFVFLFLVAAVLSFGLLLFSANTLQQAADVSAQEFARIPESADTDFYTALNRSGLYREADLIVPVERDVNSLPLINRLLYPLYIFDPDIDQLRYPGALVTNSNNEQTVLIPIVSTSNASIGNQQITQWRRVVEEVTDASGNGPYALNANPVGIDSGMVALRINYPYQSASLIAYEYRRGNSTGPVVEPIDALGEDDIFNVPVVADDSAVSDSTNFLSDNGYTLVDTATNPDIDAYPHRGTYGMGTKVAHTTLVRPYRKVVSAQAIYRRELFLSD